MGKIKPINKIENALGLPDGFYNNLLKENDWSFVIKLHSLIEASVTHLLTETLHIALKDYSTYINKERLERNISWLELSGKKVGKLSMANSIGLILEENRKFISSLSEIRNLFVHKISNVNLTLENYVTGLDKNQKKNFVSIHSGALDTQKFPTKTIRETFVKKDPKLSIWLNGISCLNEIYYCIETFSIKKSNEVLKVEMAESYQEIIKQVTAV